MFYDRGQICTNTYIDNKFHLSLSARSQERSLGLPNKVVNSSHTIKAHPNKDNAGIILGRLRECDEYLKEIIYFKLRNTTFKQKHWKLNSNQKATTKLKL